MPSVRSSLEEAAAAKLAALLNEDFEAAERAKQLEVQLMGLQRREEMLLAVKADAVFQEDFEAAQEAKRALAALARDATARLQSISSPDKARSTARSSASAGGRGGGGARAGKSPAGASGPGARGGASRRSAGRAGGRAGASGRSPGQGKPSGKGGTSVSAAATAAAHVALERAERAMQARSLAAERIAGGFHGFAARRDGKQRMRSAVLVALAVRRFVLRRRRERSQAARMREASDVLVEVLRDAQAQLESVGKIKLGLYRLTMAVRSVQAAGRRQAAMRELGRRRAQYERRRGAATLIESVARSRAASRQVTSMREAASEGAMEVSAAMAAAASGGERFGVAPFAAERDEAADVIRRFFTRLSEGTAMQERIAVIGSQLARASAAIQAAIRAKMTRIRLQQMHDAAKSIGAVRRRHTAAADVRHRAADVVAGFLQETRQRGAFFAVLHHKLMEHRLAGQRLQAGLRGMHARRRSVEVRDRLHRELQATLATQKLQATMRGARGRRKSLQRRHDLAERLAARKLQAHARGLLVRRRRSHLLRARSVLLVQAALRGWLVRWASRRARELAAVERIRAHALGARTRRQLAAAAAAARASPPIDVILRLRCAPVARDAAELGMQLVRLLRRCTEPPMRVRPARVLIRPASTLTYAAGAAGGGGVGGGGVGGGSVGADDAIVLVARLVPGMALGEVSALDAAAALLRISPVDVGHAIGATLAAPLVANVAAWTPPPRLPAAARRALHGLPAAPTRGADGVELDAGAHGCALAACGGDGSCASAVVPFGGEPAGGFAPGFAPGAIGVGAAAEHAVAPIEVGRAASEGRRAHAAHILLHYVRSLERSPAPPETAADAALAAPPADAPVSRTALVASLGVMLPLIREALHAARLFSGSDPAAGRSSHEAAAAGFEEVRVDDDGSDLALALLSPSRTGGASLFGEFGTEAAPLRGFVALQRPSAFEAAPRGPAVAGRRLRWVSHRIEIACPPTPSASYDLDGVLEDGANGAVGAYASLAQPMVRAALRGVSGCLVVVGDGAGGGSLALFGELAHANRFDGAMAWAAGVVRGEAGSARRCGLAGLVVAELLAEPGRWLSGTDDGAIQPRTAGGADGASVAPRHEPPWRVQCSAFQLSADGLVDLLQHDGGTGGPASHGARSTGVAAGAAAALGVREWPADGGVSGGHYWWPEGLARVDVLSPLDFGELLSTAMRRRLVLAPVGTSAQGHGSPLPQPPVCATMALIIEVSGTTAEGDVTSAQMVIWDLPGVVQPPSPPRDRFAPRAVEQRAAAAASYRAANAEAHAVANGLNALRTVASLLGRPSETGGSDSEASAAIAARGQPLTQLLWRALAGDCLTTCLCLASASEWQLPSTLEMVQLASTVRQLRTRPQPRRVRVAPTLDDLEALLADTDERGARAAIDIANEAALVAPLAPEDWSDLPLRMGYEPLLRDLQALAQVGGGAELEGSVLRKLVRRLLADVRRLRLASEGAANASPSGANVSELLGWAGGGSPTAPLALAMPSSAQGRRQRVAAAVEPAGLTMATQLAAERARADAAEAELRRRDRERRVASDDRERRVASDELHDHGAREAKLQAWEVELRLREDAVERRRAERRAGRKPRDASSKDGPPTGADITVAGGRADARDAYAYAAPAYAASAYASDPLCQAAARSSSSLPAALRPPSRRSSSPPSGSPSRSPLLSPMRSPARSPMRSPARSPMRSPARSPACSPARSPACSPMRSTSPPRPGVRRANAPPRANAAQPPSQWRSRRERDTHAARQDRRLHELVQQELGGPASAVAYRTPGTRNRTRRRPQEVQ